MPIPGAFGALADGAGVLREGALARQLPALPRGEEANLARIRRHSPRLICTSPRRILSRPGQQGPALPGQSRQRGAAAEFPVPAPAFPAGGNRARSTFLLAAPHCTTSARIPTGAMRDSKGLAVGGLAPGGRSARSRTRCSTPRVRGLPHTGAAAPESFGPRPGSAAGRICGGRPGGTCLPPEKIPGCPAKPSWFRIAAARSG